MSTFFDPVNFTKDMELLVVHVMQGGRHVLSGVLGEWLVGPDGPDIQRHIGEQAVLSRH